MVAVQRRSGRCHVISHLAFAEEAGDGREGIGRVILGKSPEVERVSMSAMAVQ